MTEPTSGWSVIETSFLPEHIHHSETIFTIGNGYMGSRGVFEETFPGEMRSTFLHGVFDDVPVFFTELANVPDWMELEIWLAGERFGLDCGTLLSFERYLDLKTATLHRQLRWRSPKGRTTRLTFERFASLENVHLAGVRVSITPEDYQGTVEIRSEVNGEADNLGFKHWDWLGQASRGKSAWLHCRTRTTRIELAMGIHLDMIGGSRSSRFARWDVRNHPTLAASIRLQAGETVTGIKWVTLYTSRDGRNPQKLLKKSLRELPKQDWEGNHHKHVQAWETEWERCDVLIEGDPEAQLAIRFNLFQLLSAAPRRDDRVNIGAKTLSGYGYRGHTFWDTEIFMLPFFTYTCPEIARDLLSYRWHNLPAARQKARENGYRGAQFPWESAGTGEEVTPTWVQDPRDRTKLIRIWTGDIEIHITADIVYAIWQYWLSTGDNAFLLERGAEVILEAARFWASRVEWKATFDRFEITDIIGPDEYHDHVNNNGYTNGMARWNLQTALDLVRWLKEHYPASWKKLRSSLGLKESELADWQHVINRIFIPYDSQTKLMEQFNGYFQRKDINLASMEERTESIQSILGIEGVNETQVLKQPDVLMLMYLLPDLFDDETVRINYQYYTPRTDHTFGSSLGPSIQAIMSCKVGDPTAYEQFMRAARADLFDVRGNAGDGIHGASAGGLWQAVVFGFAGLKHTSNGWTANPHLPENWSRVGFKIVDHGRLVKFDIKGNPVTAPTGAKIPTRRAGYMKIKAFLFDLDGVLTDTSEFHYQGWKRLADEESLPFTRQDNEALRGVSRRESLNLLLKDRQIDEETAQAWMNRKNHYYLELVEKMAPADLLPGALDLLHELRAAGIKTVVASASKNAGLVIERLNLAREIDAVADARLVAQSKPAPDIFLKAADLVGVTPRQCVVVEDAAAGIEAGKAAGMLTLGIGPRERLGKADVILPSLEKVDLSDLLDKLAAVTSHAPDSSF